MNDLTIGKVAVATGVPVAACDVVWFHPSGNIILGRADCRVPVGLKEATPPRPICYCFEHTIEEIESEIRERGTTDIPATIAAKCRQGLDRCEETNPQGSCCRGNINKVVKAARPQSDQGAFSLLDPGDCCSPSPKGESHD